ncbi:MAG: hypothetical protein HZR80_14330 [Candidatus Heimdallarchaeota archaeon]
MITKPREETNKNFPRIMFSVGSIMFIAGTIGVIVIIVGIIGTTDFDTAITVYQLIPYHRHWSPDYASYIPLFSWFAQFLAVNGFSLMLVMLLFRLIEYRGKSKKFSDKTRFIRRFGTVAFSNYNNQLYLLYYVLFNVVSIIRESV